LVNQGGAPLDRRVPKTDYAFGGNILAKAMQGFVVRRLLRTLVSRLTDSPSAATLGDRTLLLTTIHSLLLEIAPVPLPPGPDLPPWRQAQAWVEHPVEFWEECAARYGEVFTVQLGSIGATVLFSNPQAVREIFQLPAETFTCRQFNEQYKYVMGGESLLLSDGPVHKHRRRLHSPTLQRQVSRYAPLVRRVTREAIENWPVGEPFSPRLSLHALSLQVVLSTLFDAGESDVHAKISQAFNTQVFQDLGTWSPWARFGRLQPDLRELLAAAIQRKRACSEEGKGGALFDALVRAQDEQGRPLGDEEIQDHVFSMLIAGVDPTALALAWTLYWVHAHPPVLCHVLGELASLGSDPEPARLASLPYLTAVCQESLRMVPVVPTPSGRKLTAPAIIGGHPFEPATTLLPCTYLLHRREALYPNADCFKPERFLERTYAPYEYAPFGGGNRLCIGGALAQLELKVSLATILARWELELDATGKVTPARHGTLLAPSAEFLLLSRGPAESRTK
jgi:unspecific monooxygenase